MKIYNPQKKWRGRGLPKRLIWLPLGIIIVLVAATALVWNTYHHNLKPVSNDQRTQIVKIESGSTVKQIGQLLKSKHLIRSSAAFDWYVHSKELGSKLQAGTYAFSPSESIPQIIKTLTQGNVATGLVTILPGRRIDQVKADLINDGFSPAAVEAALNPNVYSDLAALSYKPAVNSTLEGLLFPESFQKTADTDPAVILRQSLILMGQHLTPDLQAAFANQGLSVYQGIILASIIEQEVSKPGDRAQAAQVFLKRLKSGMMLGSDVTAYYGAVAAGHSASLSYDSPYNTLQHTGLPPGPISTISDASLQAAAHPAATDWLYFVSGDNGNTYFSKTLQEHEALTKQYCHKLCSQ